jgi:N-acetyl-gamma-glutamyl-phosphate reductase
MSRNFKAAVIGGSGYGGAELIRRLLLHPEVELLRVASVDHVGEPVGAVHLALTGRTALRFEDLAPAVAAAGCDVVLLGLPHGVSARKMPEILSTGARVVDMSGDFRLRDAASYARFYGGPHPHPELLASFVYGLPELHRERIRAARAVASPGCFATTIELGLLPLAAAGLLAGAIEAVGITGSSGAGVVPGATTHHPVRAVNLRSYKVLEHQHTPEIEQTLREAAGGGPTGVPGADARIELRFVPVSAPLTRGILATSFVQVPAAVTPAAITEIFRRHYAAEPFVRFVSDRGAEVAAVAGSNFAEVSFTLGEAVGPTRTLVVQSATDNLIKGGAGQAIQNMNLMLGLPETLSLEDSGPWP